MQRSAGVTASAIVALLGSLMALAMGMLMVVALWVTRVPPPSEFPGPPEFFKAIMVLVPLFYLLPAAWGITTSIGLFRLRNWARISIIVFAALLALSGLFAMLTSFALPFASAPGAGVDPNFLLLMRVFTVAFALLQLGIGIWWLVFFNRAKVREQFVPPRMAFAGIPVMPGTPPPPSLYPAPSPQPVQSPPMPAAPSLLNSPGRPVSITIIGWYLLLGSLLLPVNLFLHTPAVLLLKIVTGWPAIIYFLVMLVLNVYIGIGLLRLQSAARLTGIAYFVFAFLNSAVFFFAPRGLARIAKLVEMQQSMFPWMRPMRAPTHIHLT